VTRAPRALLTVLLLLAGGAEAGAAEDILVRLRPEHRHHADRVREAAAEAIAQSTEWFGPPPFERLTVESAPAGSASIADRPGHIVVPMHWLQPSRSLLLEADVTRAVIRQWWGVGITIPDRFLADGIAEYAHARILERIYDRRYQREAYSTYEVRFFGGLVPWAIRALRLDRATAVIRLGGYRRQADVDVRSTALDLRRVQAAKVAVALITLERYVGWPALQRGFSLAAERYRGKAMTAAAFAQAVSDASDRDLSWFFTPVFNGPSHWDYAVESMTTEVLTNATCGSASCVRSTVIVQRNGNTPFTGTSQEPSGGFQSGRAVEIELQFADGQVVSERWDGRSDTRQMVYDAPSPVIRATVDPRQVLALDLRRLNNGRATGVGASRGRLSWTARWTIWLQDLLMTHAVLY
jgi:hypothetical protein